MLYEVITVFLPFNFDNLVSNIPLLKNFPASISSYSFENPIDSSDANPELWIRIAGIITKQYDNFDGFVILHGSDTMAYTASALSFIRITSYNVCYTKLLRPNVIKYFLITRKKQEQNLAKMQTEPGPDS